MKPLGYFDAGELPTLAKCAQVSWSWFKEATPILWIYRTERRKTLVRGVPWDDLQDIFRGIEPSRRQMYANHVYRASLVFDNGGCHFNSDAYDEGILKDLIFPHLVGLQIFVINDLPLPAFQAPKLAWINLDPRYETYYKNIWDTNPKVYTPLFESILVRAHSPILRMPAEN